MHRGLSKTALALSALVCSTVGCSADSEPECESQAGVACTWAGTTQAGFNGDGLARLDSRLYWPLDVEFAQDGSPWLIDWNNHRLRRVQENGTLQTVVGVFIGDGPPDQSDLSEHGAHGSEVSLNHPTDMQFAPDGTLYFAAWHNHKLRVVDADSQVHVMCGRGPGFAGDGESLAGALFNQPKAIALGPDGSLYVLDQRNLRIRKVDPGPNGSVSTLAGTGQPGFRGDGGPALAAQFNFQIGGNPEPSGALALSPDAKHLYVSDGLNHRIRRIDLADKTIDTIAGTGEPGFSGDGGPAREARIHNVTDLEFGPDGRLYLADTENHRIRAIDLLTGTLETVAGNGSTELTTDGLAPLQTSLQRPFGIAFDGAGSLYVADTYHHRIVKIAKVP